MSAEDEVEDGSSDEEEDLGAVEEERSVILHLLSQLKLGMDLTRVGGVRRSLLSTKAARDKVMVTCSRKRNSE